MVLADGKEPDGLTYRTVKDGESWVVTVTSADGKTTLEERFPVMYGAVCGPDVADIAHANEIIDRLIKRLRES